jgi:DNA repair protein SbcD/Mre11
MKIVHFADLHIGVENYGHIDPETGLSSRLGDFLRAFDELVDYALDWRADVVLFAGDAYRSREPTQTHQKEFARRIQRLSAAGIPVYLLVGNHDLPNAWGRATALDIFATLDVPRVYVAARLATTVIPTQSGPLQVVGVPWPNRSTLMTRDEIRGLGVEQIDHEIEKRLGEHITRQAEALDPTLPAVLVAHIAMHGSKVKTGSEGPMTAGRFPALLPSALDPERFDYVALGHHHIQQQVGSRPPIYYAGSMQRVDFGEEHDPKGFMAVTLDPTRPAGERVTEAAFREVTARRFVTIELQIRTDDPTDEVVRAIERADIRGAVVRVQLQLTPQQNALLREPALIEALRPAFFVAGVARTIQQERRRRVSNGAELRLRPEEAVRLWLQATDRPADYSETLLDHARRVIEAEDGAAGADDTDAATARED